MQSQSREKLNIKKGDTVIVIAGKDKGKQGAVLSVNTKSSRVTVKDINVVTRHVKPNNKNPQGGTTRKESGLHISNVMMADPKTGKATRVGRKLVDGKMVRVAKKSGTVLN